MGEISLNIAVFQDHRALVKLNIVTIHCWTSQMSTFGAIFALKTFEKKKEIFTTDTVNPCNLLNFLIFLPRVYHDPLLFRCCCLCMIYQTNRQTDTHTCSEYCLLCFQFTKWFHTIYPYLSISNLSSISISLSISHFFSVSGEYLRSAHLDICLSILYILPI